MQSTLQSLDSLLDTWLRWAHCGIYTLQKLELCPVCISAHSEQAHTRPALSFSSADTCSILHTFSRTHTSVSDHTPSNRMINVDHPCGATLHHNIATTYGEGAVLPENARSTDFWTQQALHQGFKHIHSPISQCDRRVPHPSCILVTGGYLLPRTCFSNSAFPQTPANHLAS